MSTDFLMGDNILLFLYILLDSSFRPLNYLTICSRMLKEKSKLFISDGNIYSKQNKRCIWIYVNCGHFDVYENLLIKN